MKINDLFNFLPLLKNGYQPTKLTFVRKLSFLWLILATGSFTTLAAPEFKIRYNQKFPCLEVMDSKAVKITDVTEGAKGETVTSGKASISISFAKNAEGQPEVTLSDARGPLSEMEIEAFGLSVGLKPAGTVLVRFGPDHKPKFEMDRTGGARFLMADLGNLDTAAGKELVAVAPVAPAAGNPAAASSNGISKTLARFRERLAAWKAAQGKGGWSNRPGKVLSCGKQSMITYSGMAPRILLDGEAVQTGAEIAVGLDAPITFQSGPGVFQKALPGTKFVIAPLEKGQKDVKIILAEGTLLTLVAEPLALPRVSLLGLENGVVVQTGDATYQVVKSASGSSFTVAHGSVRLVEEAGAAQVSQISAGATGYWPNSRAPGQLVPGSPEAATLKQLAEDARRDFLTDMTEDAIKAAAADADTIVREACGADPAFAKIVAQEISEIRPDLFGLIVEASGCKDLPPPPPMPGAQLAFGKRAEPWLRGEPSPLIRPGKVLQIEGKVMQGEEPVKRSTVLQLGELIRTGGDGRVLFKGSAGVVAEIPPGSEVVILEMTADWKGREFRKSKTLLEVKKGDAFLSVVKELEGKVMAEVRSPRGLASNGDRLEAKK